MNRPAIDHGILSPSGRISRRARDRAIRDTAAELFPPGYWESAAPSTEDIRQRLIHQARELRELAARGMGVRKHLREAERLEQEAREL